MDRLGLTTTLARDRDHGDAETGGDQTLHRRNLGRLEHDVRVEIILGAEVVGELSQAVLLGQRNEGLSRRRGQSQPGSRGQPMTGRDGQAQAFDIESKPDEAGPVGPWGGDRQVGLTVEHSLRDLMRRPLEQLEADPRHGVAESSKLFRYIPTRQ